MKYPLDDLSFVAASYAMRVLVNLLPDIEIELPFLQENSFTLFFTLRKGSFSQTLFPDIENEARRLWKENSDYEQHLMTTANAAAVFHSQKQPAWEQNASSHTGTLFSLIRIGDYYLPCEKEQLGKVKDLFIRPLKCTQENERIILACAFSTEKAALKQKSKKWKESTPCASFENTGPLQGNNSFALDTIASSLKRTADTEGFTPVTLLKTCDTLEEATLALAPFAPAFSTPILFDPDSCSFSPFDLWIAAISHKECESRLNYYLQFIEGKGKIPKQKTRYVLAYPESKLSPSLRSSAKTLKQFIERCDEGKTVNHAQKFVRLSWFIPDVYGEYWETAFLDLLEEKKAKTEMKTSLRFSVCNSHTKTLQLINELNEGLPRELLPYKAYLYATEEKALLSAQQFTRHYKFYNWKLVLCKSKQEAKTSVEDNKHPHYLVSEKEGKIFFQRLRVGNAPLLDEPCFLLELNEDVNKKMIPAVLA